MRPGVQISPRAPMPVVPRWMARASRGLAERGEAADGRVAVEWVEVAEAAGTAAGAAPAEGEGREARRGGAAAEVSGRQVWWGSRPGPLSGEAEAIRLEWTDVGGVQAWSLRAADGYLPRPSTSLRAPLLRPFGSPGEGERQTATTTPNGNGGGDSSLAARGRPADAQMPQRTERATARTVEDGLAAARDRAAIGAVDAAVSRREATEAEPAVAEVRPGARRAEFDVEGDVRLELSR